MKGPLKNITQAGYFLELFTIFLLARRPDGNAQTPRAIRAAEMLVAAAGPQYALVRRRRTLVGHRPVPVALASNSWKKSVRCGRSFAAGFGGNTFSITSAYFSSAR